MPLEVFLVEDAERDIEDIYRYIAEHDSIENAGRVIDALEQLCAKLAELPERGNIPRELRGLGISEYREVNDDSFRVIYRVFEGCMVIYCVVDGRRDMQNFLQRRILG
jgi:toxin ParE1/3/4